MFQKIKRLMLENITSKQTIVKNVAWLSVSQVGSRLIRAIIIIYAARALGTQGYGVFSYALALSGFFAIFSSIGVDTILTREAAQKPKDASRYFTNTLWIKTGLLFITALIVIFIAPYFSDIEEVKLLLPFIAFLIVFDNIRELCIAFFRSQEKMEYEALTMIFTNVAITVFGLVAILLLATPKALTLSYIIGAGAGMLMALYLLRKRFIRIRVFDHFNKKLVKEIIVAAWPVGLYGIVGSFMLNVDIIMLGWFKSANEIGIYSVGQRVVQMLYILPTIFASSTFPALARLISLKNREKIQLMTEKILLSTFLIAIPVVAGGLTLGKQIIGFLYGPEYLVGTISFQILLTTILFVFPIIALGNLILGFNQQKKMIVFSAIASLSNIFFNVVLIPLYGINGAAMATIIVQTIYAFMMWRFAKGLTPFHVIRHLKRIVVASLLMVIIAFTLRNFGLHLIVNIIISIMAYFAFLYLLKEPLIEESGLLRFLPKRKNKDA